MSDSPPAVQKRADVLVIGSGAAGCLAAISAAREGAKVLLVTKGRVPSGVSGMARGGFGAALAIRDARDEPRLHVEDVVRSGGGLVSRRRTEIWAREIVPLVRELEGWGVGLVREGEDFQQKEMPKNVYPRALHAHDHTGVAVMKCLSARLKKVRTIERVEQTCVLDLALRGGRCVGAVAWNYDRGHWLTLSAPAVVLASGGGSALYLVHDNPPLITGDGYALAYRAGASIVNLEMIDFQPLCIAPEEMRGFAPHPTGFIIMGSRFRNALGEEFMERYYPGTAEQASRAEICRAMALEVHHGRGTPAGGVYLDSTHLPLDTILRYAPHIYRQYKNHGIDLTRRPQELAPGSHTWLGGAKIDDRAATEVPGLFAAGDNAGGIHGANRIGGSALSATMVFGVRAGKAAAAHAAHAGGAGGGRGEPDAEVALDGEGVRWISAVQERREGVPVEELRRRVREVAQRDLNVVREGKRLEAALARLDEMEARDLPRLTLGPPDVLKGMGSPARFQAVRSAIETRNLCLVARMLAAAALFRAESRGAHYRLDHPETDPRWERLTRIRRGPGGEMECGSVPVDD
ncbi:MAG: FAD-dependent oxidoreductase [Nitrospinota bacterium]